MAWYGQQPTAAEIARGEQQKEEARQRKEAQQRAEAARDPYGACLKWPFKPSGGR